MRGPLTAQESQPGFGPALLRRGASEGVLQVGFGDLGVGVQGLGI